MSELIQWINDPINYPLDTRWEDLPVELRVPPVSRVYADANAEILERMMVCTNSVGSAYFPTARDVLVSHLLAFTPRAECWVGRVLVGTQAELDRIHHYVDEPWALSCSDDDGPDEPDDPDDPDASSEPLPDCPVCPEPAEPPQFWSEEDWKKNIAELAEIQQELASEEWDRLHPEERGGPPRE